MDVKKLRKSSKKFQVFLHASFTSNLDVGFTENNFLIIVQHCSRTEIKKRKFKGRAKDPVA